MPSFDERPTRRPYARIERERRFALDVYEEPPSAHGTILAEFECDDDVTLAAVRQPPWAIREVTDDPRLSGASLADHRTRCDGSRR